MGRPTMTVAAIAIACGATARADVDQSTVKAFVQALVDGDAATIRQLVIDDADHQAAALALGRFSHAGLALEAACQRRFHTTIRSDGNPKIRLSLPDAHDVDYARVDQPDDRFATVLLDDGKNPYRVARVGDAWRVDMTDARTSAASSCRATRSPRRWPRSRRRSTVATSRPSRPLATSSSSR